MESLWNKLKDPEVIRLAQIWRKDLAEQGPLFQEADKFYHNNNLAFDYKGVLEYTLKASPEKALSVLSVYRAYDTGCFKVFRDNHFKLFNKMADRLFYYCLITP